MKLAGADLGVGEYLGEGGGTAVAVDGVGDAGVEGDGERHGLDVAEGVVPELELRLEQLLAMFGDGHFHYSTVRCRPQLGAAPCRLYMPSP